LETGFRANITPPYFQHGRPADMQQLCILVLGARARNVAHLNAKAGEYHGVWSCMQIIGMTLLCEISPQALINIGCTQHQLEARQPAGPQSELSNKERQDHAQPGLDVLQR